MGNSLIIPMLKQNSESKITDPKEELKGSYFGKELNGSALLLPFNHGERQLPPNWCILGKSGKGMKVSAEKIMLQALKKGGEVIVIDPERDYEEFIERLGQNDIIIPFETERVMKDE